jgi:hypothetical protein
MSREQVERLLFVGVSRAVKWAYFSTDENQQFTPLEKILALAESKQITVQGTPRQRGLMDDVTSARPIGSESVARDVEPDRDALDIV